MPVLPPSNDALQPRCEIALAHKRTETNAERQRGFLKTKTIVFINKCIFIGGFLLLFWYWIT